MYDITLREEKKNELYATKYIYLAVEQCLYKQIPSYPLFHSFFLLSFPTHLLARA